MKLRDARDRLEAVHRAALQAVDAGAAVRRVISGGPGPSAIAGRPLAEGARVVVAALGKAAAPMTHAALEVLGDRVAGGLVVTKDGHAEPAPGLPFREAAHPVPDARGADAASELLALAASAREDDVLLVLLSGGASALTTLPAPGLDLGDLAAATEALLACGADIAEVNTVRKHLTRFSGGRLALAARSRRIEVLAVSDVSGDALDVIGSGPCAADPTSYAGALEVLRARGAAAAVPTAAREHLERGARGELPETPKAGDPALAGVRHTIVASNAEARSAACRAADGQGLRGVDLGEVLRGEARDAGRRLAALARAAQPREPCCWVAGGETTVTLRGSGRGGRSQELALAAAIELSGDSRVALLAAGTDGTDGPTDAAGAYADGDTVTPGDGLRAARSALRENDAYGFFSGLRSRGEGGLVFTGPTGTNVMDLALVAIMPR